MREAKDQSAAAGPLFIPPALAHRLPAGEHGVEQRRSAPDAGVHRERAEFAVLRATTALDAEIPVDDERFFLANSKHAARAHLRA